MERGCVKGEHERQRAFRRCDSSNRCPTRRFPRGIGYTGLMQSLIITLDGPAGSGKSTVARRVAQRLGLEFLDTGAMYRGLTALCLDQGMDPSTHTEQVLALLDQAHLHFDWSADPPRLHGNLGEMDRDVTDRLRDADVTSKVSDIAAMPQVRAAMVRLQQAIGRHHARLVSEGRDQGSVVFPQAQAKFYLDAQPQVRARRRAEQLRLAGKPVDEKQILDQIVTRDERDKNRSDGPLICPSDALRIDTSAMSLSEVVDMVERCVRQRCGLSLRESSSSRQEVKDSADRGLS